MEQKAILAKLWELRKRTAGISFPKTGLNKNFSYEYYTESDVFGVINPILAELGILPNYMITNNVVDTMDKGYRYRAEGIMQLIDMESGECFDFGPILADGADNVDKAAYKANTGFVRTIWCKFLGLSNKDEPENEGTRMETTVRKVARPSNGKSPAAADVEVKQAVVWDKDKLFAAASKAGKLAQAQKLRTERMEWADIASQLGL
jgi:hypothetical protein